ncbi:MAG TPA: hypothetical protein DHW71_12405 [Gammaproteobacteria bacterium]|nr:hypothetical protein [Gammaproteobacteria bacterium]MEC8011956.1 hypothetical protein [Pseudomonadota bacterium]HBF07145.1 hypothetical protein [Gammaproteobacteria bacterium]HCK93790.1 hypothetical protein [Gammaproteobacteria bacterium]|tara:strand:+ start:551 stop:901 length:351 start_codon:yes stop_codon:yes gene_type:complete
MGINEMGYGAGGGINLGTDDRKILAGEMDRGGNPIVPSSSNYTATPATPSQLESATRRDNREVPENPTKWSKAKIWYNGASKPAKIGVWLVAAAAFTGVVLGTLHGAFKASGMYDK